jgi:Vacuolar sorting-associated protein 13, N-terminal/N-terminal region of Chorein or VPS13
MAKRLLLNILVDVLDDYVEGLSIENLKLGVLSGKIELNNLQLKRTGLDKLNLPISITHGSLKQLKLKVPWTALESKPVRVIIDGVYLQAGPLDVSSLSPEQLRKMASDAKRQKLKAAEDAVMAAGQSPEDMQEKNQKASYIQQLTAKIVDNIEITLTNVHIRYEDNLTIPGTTLSAGITVASISLVTTDSHWNEAFIARESKLKTSAIRKLGKLENLGIYWNRSSRALDPLSPSDWEHAMQNMIYTSEDNSGRPKDDKVASRSGVGSKGPRIGGKGKGDWTEKNSFDDYRCLDYILATPNSLTVKIIHTERPSEGEPKIDMMIGSTSFALHLDKVVYQQALGVGAMFGLLDKQKQIALLRPLRRPTRDPRGWWHYAYKLITGRTVSTASKVERGSYDDQICWRGLSCASTLLSLSIFLSLSLSLSLSFSLSLSLSLILPLSHSPSFFLCLFLFLSLSLSLSLTLSLPSPLYLYSLSRTSINQLVTCILAARVQCLQFFYADFRC